MECKASVQSGSPRLSDPWLFVLVPGFSPSPHTNKENPYGTMLACWASQEEADTDSSNEGEDTGVNPDGPMEGDPASNSSSNTNKYVNST